MQFKNILVAGLAAAGVSATLAAREDAAVIVHEVVTYSPSVVYSTRVQTVTQCAANVTDCPEISGALTSVIDSTTTICPVTETAAISTSGKPIPGNSAPLQTLTVTLTNSSFFSEWTSTVTAQLSTVTLSDTISTITLSELTHSGASTSSSQPGNTLASPENATKTETTSTSVVKSTSFVYATVTLPANASSTASGPSSFANSTVTITTAASSFSTNAVGALTGTASSTFSYSAANGTLATPTAPASTSESIVPFLGAATRDVTPPLLVLVMLALIV